MAILSISQLGALKDIWINIISWMSNAIPSYAWAIVLLTIGIKIVMLPLDFYNKKVSRTNSQMQKVIQPQLEKAKAQYGHDKTLYNQKMNEIYKKNNYNVVGSCLFMLVNLVLTLTIFISLLNGMNEMASRRITQQYAQLQQVYTQTLDENEGNVELANEAVVIKYEEIKDSWLWIQNIWKSDTNTSSIPNFDEYTSVAKEISFNGVVYKTKDLKKNISEEDYKAIKADYEKIMEPLKEEIGRNNGYYILVVFVVLTSVLSQWLATRKMKTADPNDPTQSTNKVMMLVLPILLGSFALTSTSIFSIYLVISQLIAVMFTPLIDLLLDKQFKEEKVVKKTNKNTPIYSRENVKGVFEKKEVSSQPKKAKEKKND